MRKVYVYEGVMGTGGLSKVLFGVGHVCFLVFATNIIVHIRIDINHEYAI